jgi:hypothetical protein
MPAALLARAYFELCLAAGRLLRSAKYSSVRVERDDRASRVLKHRRFYAPLLIWLGGPLVRILDTGVRVLPQRDWEERERHMYMALRAASIRIDEDGVVVLPRLAGDALAALLNDPAVDGSIRTRAIGMAAAALAELHRRGFTHGDAMAENVLVDLDAGVAHWLDFETVHDLDRPAVWRRADDVRALLVTCIVRTTPDTHAATLACILDAYGDEDVARLVAASFASVWRRALPFHLAQAALSFQCFRAIGGRLRDRPAAADASPDAGR